MGKKPLPLLLMYCDSEPSLEWRVRRGLFLTGIFGIRKDDRSKQSFIIGKPNDGSVNPTHFHLVMTLD